ncbi:PhoH family protein [Fusobacterium perfoetens]|uniref:PhoH family protein n=1 Tax=Fusobacterium perfoetens TaxID=852 RepID=UPI0004839E00|nr:PhoH family protein [Fusobacterium perfoetens]MCI6151560.1 PhoH family protein [Fusobacterium perfoetens]MDY3237218.1 PhoH family protein [Fusobacterium perfoetens]
MRKIFILDTNILIHDPNSIYNFRGNDVFLPIEVIEEIDKLKGKQDTGMNARMASRVIEEIRKKGNLSKGVELPDEIFFKVIVESGKDSIPEGLKKDSTDNSVLGMTIKIKNKYPDRKVILVTKDINLRIKADAIGIEVEDYSTDRVMYDELDKGYLELEISKTLFDKYDKTGKIDISELNLDFEPSPNFFFIMKAGQEKTTGRVVGDKIKKFVNGDICAWGARARNDEQKFAMDLLMDDDIKAVTLVGKAGTGKTLLAIAAGLEQVVERKKYSKLYIARPIIPMGKDLGYLPGNEKEKLRPWMQPIFDNIELLSDFKGDKTGEKVITGLETMGLLKVEALTYIRGRSIPNGFIIIDEAQNLTPLEIKTIITRAGENTKIVFTGDPYQIDSPYLDANTNGLTYMAEKLKDEKIIGHITLVKGERSPLAEISAKLL